jgi:hypothetical protein
MHDMEPLQFCTELSINKTYQQSSRARDNIGVPALILSKRNNVPGCIKKPLPAQGSNRQVQLKTLSTTNYDVLASS